jgi:tetratricopeptide (TPR) repeat protein
MTKAIFISFTISVLLGFSGKTQEWRDSLNMARTAYSNKNFKLAFQYYQSAQKKAPKNINIANEIGQTAYRLGDFNAAAKWLSKSKIKTTEKQAKVHHNLGNSFMQQKQYAQAVEAYKQSLRKEPNSEKTRYNLSEAIRKLKEQQKDKNKKDQNQPKKSTKKEKKKPSKKNKNPNKNKDPKDSKGDQNSARLPNKSIERLLDQLTRAEAATMKKLNKGKEVNGFVRSGKDW